MAKNSEMLYRSWIAEQLCSWQLRKNIITIKHLINKTAYKFNNEKKKEEKKHDLFLPLIKLYLVDNLVP